ncbi:MAG: PD-(D/E)XK nuclease family protein [Mariprofundaceae bacterium]|nr:PD-(D/E)XK nuclease family protein [Mariprofundaceae bacterium]
MSHHGGYKTVKAICLTGIFSLLLTGCSAIDRIGDIGKAPDLAAIETTRVVPQNNTPQQKIIQIKKARLIEDGLNESQAETEAKTFMDELNYFLTSFRFDAREGIPPQKLIEICQWIKKGMKSPALKQSMAQALAQVDRMVELAESYNTPISKAQIERMLDSVIAEGGQNPDSHAQATPWHTVADVGAIAAPVETIIWWGFNDSNQSSITFWSEAERDALKQSNVHLENTAVVRARESRQWQQAITCAGKQLILIAPKKDKGELTQLHPLWDEIRYYATSSVEVSKLKEEVCSYLEWSGANFNAQAHFELAGRKVFLSNEDKAYLKSSEIMLSVEKDTIKKPDNLSFSQMSTLLACPTKWAFQYHAKLSSMDSLSLPTGNTMIGSLCHKIVEDIYTDESQWSVSTVREYTSELFDMRVPQMAAELLEPGRELERERYRISVCDAVDALLKTIAQADLKVIKTEGKVDGKDLDGIPFRGYIDLLLEDNDGQVFVIDLKWSGSVRYKKNEVEEGKALQLASYAWMLRENDESWAPGAYFMLAQGELLTDDYRFKTVDVIESPLAAKDVWALGSKTWHNMFYQAIAGDIEVSGLLDEKELKAHREGQGLMYINPPCHFCEFGKLCGKTRAIA